MSYKVGDKVRITKVNIFGDSEVGQEGEIIEIEDMCAFDVPIKIRIDDNGFEEIVYSNEDSIEKVAPEKNKSNKFDKAWEKQMDHLLGNRNGANVSQSECTHEFVIVGTGIYGDYWNCKHCDVKKEDCEEESKRIVIDDVNWDIPF
jgi:hypothetical protein